MTKGHYKPQMPLKDKNVLDVGACCGETAWYYLQLGAKKVYCIEIDPVRLKMLEENKKNLNLNIEIIPEPFKIEHLQLPYDFIKCDVEGEERIIIEYIDQGNKLKPCILEVHSDELKSQFEKRGFRTLTVLRDKTIKYNFYLMTNEPDSKN